MMKKLFNILVILSVLVVPALARATPCQAMKGPMDMTKGQPCPHYDGSNAVQQKDMVMSDCIDLENALVQTDSIKDTMLEKLFTAILVENFVSEVTASYTDARAPPERTATNIPKSSIFMTTGRIRL